MNALSKTTCHILLTAAICTTVWNTARAGETESLKVAKALSSAFADVAEQVMPSVVGIQVEKMVKQPRSRIYRFNGKKGAPADPEEMMRRFFGGGDSPFEMPEGMERRVPGAGSGVIIDKEGHILTNNHVIEGEDVRLEVQLWDDRKYRAEVVGSDPKSDLAVIKLLDVEGDLPAATLGNSDALRVGNIVIAIGNPFQLRQTVTTGIVSAKNRSIAAFNKMMYQNFIQTDASINPGNSGGPLVNLDGKVIGINTAIRSGGGGGSDGVGFAVPVNQAKMVVKQLIEKGKVTRGWLGIGINDLTPELAEQFENVTQGILVREVYANTPAGKAGVKHGDVIVAFDGKAVRYSRELQAHVASTVPSSTVPMTVVRAGKRVTLNVIITEQPDDPTKILGGGTGEADVDNGTAKDETIGIEVQELDEDLREKFSLKDGDAGILITNVTPDSPAARKGIQRGSLLIEMDHKPVKSAADFAKAVEGIKDRKSILLYVRQLGNNRYVVLPLVD